MWLRAAPFILRTEQQPLPRRLRLISCSLHHCPLLSSLPSGLHFPQSSPKSSRTAKSHSFHLALQPGPIFSFPHIPKQVGSRKDQKTPQETYTSGPDSPMTRPKSPATTMASPVSEFNTRATNNSCGLGCGTGGSLPEIGVKLET